MYEYDFSISGVIKEGFKKSYGYKWLFFAAVLLYALLEIVLNAIFTFILIPDFYDIVGLLVLPFTLPMLSGIIILGINRVREKPVDIKQILDYYPLILTLLGAYFLVLLLTIVGFVFLVLPGIYLSVAYVFTLSLVADKGLGVWEAMELSRKTVTHRWWKFLGLSIVVTLILIVSIIPLGIGLIWSVPMTYITYGLMYHRLFDEEETSEEETTNHLSS